MMLQLADAWLEFRDDPALRVAILTGHGHEAFCVGGDLQLLMPLFTGARKPADEWDERLLANLDRVPIALLKPFELYKPIIAAVNGYALAGGCEILQATDLRIASRTASFGSPRRSAGSCPAADRWSGSRARCRTARRWRSCCSATACRLPRAHRIGLVNEVVEPERVLPRAEELAARLAKNGPLALRKIKEAVLRTSGEPLARAYEIENECSAVVMASKDAREGPRAFMEKREPVFTGE
jgi:enoyl-CoA hydratase